MSLCAIMLAAMSHGVENLRGFGRVGVNHEIHETHENGAVSVMRFECETEENAETVAGKFLYDLYAEDGVTFKDGIHETKGGAAFAVERDGKMTVIYGAEKSASLRLCVKDKTTLLNPQPSRNG